MSKFNPYDHLNVSLNEDGTLTRYVKLPAAPPNSDPSEAVLSKDVTLSAENKTWMRLYRPSKISPGARLPVILYFHPGGWIQMSVAESIIHEFSYRMAAEIPSIIVAVDFRLAPEHRLPAQYEDAMDAVTWVQKQAGDGDGEPWIKDYGDLNRCYLYGVSCGANIVYNTALRLREMKPQPLKIAGTILNQPFIGGKNRTKSELNLATDPYFPLPVIDLLWELALPVGTDRDHRFCNPLVDAAMKEKVRSLGRCLVIGFGGDPLVDRQQELVRMLVERGVQVEARFDDIGFHNIDLIDKRRALAILNFIKEFV
ncbi:probable carboxylesterase 9 [Salvia splendens]|uniref:probable carboxylesterase 9 n=1 Tax=Salvia splendens TaxID=180675 RepID=UPI001C256A7F|nr:probable carboxylesterase 9 [Salvia splendens]